MCSRRSSSQRTGRPKRIASSGMSTSSGYTMSLEPKPPPTSGAITRTRWGGRSSSSQMNWRTWCGACVEAHTVSSPAIALYSATSPRVSMGWPPARPIDRLKRARGGLAGVGERPHAGHAGSLERARDVDPDDARVGVRAADDGGVQHAGERNVADVAPAALDEPRVFLAEEPVPDELHAGSVSKRPQLTNDVPLVRLPS